MNTPCTALLLALLPLVPQDEIRLGEGRLIRGQIVKETPTEIFVDVGHTILTVPRDAVVEITRSEPTGTAEAPAGSRADRGLWTEVERPEVSVRQNVERVGNGVVLVRVPGALGSGFVTTDRGHVVTNAHIVQGERNITVTFFEAGEQGFERKVIDGIEIVAVNPYWDLALLRVPAARLGELELTPIPFGSYDDLVVGQPVFAVGNPLGLERTVSEGIISTRNRAQDGQLYVQTTAAINPGNSGGPLFNLEGEMIGVTTWTYFGTEGLSFAIPVSTVRTFLEMHEAFAYDKEQPNTGYRYLRPPRKGEERGDT